MRHIVKKRCIISGALTDCVIRYETQGRGSVHAHMLWWIDLDPQYQDKDDIIDLPEEMERLFHLVVTDVATQRTCRLYDKVLLNYANGNIWALKEILSIDKKLRILKRDDQPEM